MRIPHILTLMLGVAALAIAVLGVTEPTFAQDSKVIALPLPRLDGAVSVEKALAGRRSIREFRSPIPIAEVSQLLWAAQGINGPGDPELRPLPTGHSTASKPQPRGECHRLAQGPTGHPQGAHHHLSHAATCAPN